MKKRVGYLFWILLLALGLMTLITTAQLLAKQNINGLRKGNRESTITFEISNSLQDLVNLSFQLESKISNTSAPVSYRQSLIDSLDVLGYNAYALNFVADTIYNDKEIAEKFDKLNHFAGHQKILTQDALQQIKTGKKNENIRQIDSLRTLHLGDSIYSTALTIEKYLETDLETTISNNNTASSRLSAYNTILAIIAVTAILMLGTVIINRHIKQMQLISDLEKSKTEAQHLARVKDQFLANMSHEIRTPLNAIKGFTKILSQTSLDKDQHQYINIVNEASNNLIYIVNDILDISKIEAGKLRIEQKDFDLWKVLQTAEHLFSNTAAEKKLQYIQLVDRDVPLRLNGDADRLLQIISNLVSNAIKFTDTGSVKTLVSKIKEDNEKVWIALSVQDTGDGIPADKKETIFQRFEQLEGSANLSKGTGLGLSIVKSLTTLMHGSIELSSELGKGSTFRVALPFTKTTPSQNIPIKEGADQVYNYQGSAVLVVEDNKVNQLILEHMLGKTGIIVDTAINGRDALGLVKKKSYDLILLDIQMPVMNGYETIQELRNVMHITTPVIAMTAYALPGEEEKCLQAGMTGYLSKPVDFSKMFSLLNKYLQPEHAAVKNSEEIKSGAGDFLLELTGGDKDTAKKILQEIIAEIPGASKKLSAIKKNKNGNDLNGTLHHLVSTFSPLGPDTAIMKKIQWLREHEHTADNEKDFSKLNELIEEIGWLEDRLKRELATYLNN